MAYLLFSIGGLFNAATLVQVDDLTVLKARTDQPAPEKIMTVYFQQLAHSAFDRRTAEYEKIKTTDQLTAYQKRMREFFIARIGGLPERTPLNAKVVGRLDGDGYRIEKIIYESQPRFFVTAALYLPIGNPPYPGVLVPCGHSNSGKAEEAYQRACILLAKNGLAALCYDPIGQGERYQILGNEGKPVYSPTHEHTLVGVGCILLGTNAARYRIWDGMRGIDYLLSREDIDPKRIGCTGNSGGGTLTSYIMALDQRVQCAAPSCYLATLRWLIDEAGPQDAEQNIHTQVAFGMEHADYIMMRAPKPTLICAATQDFFDIKATWQTFRQAKRFYTRVGFAERVDLFEADAKHGFSTNLRVGMVRWMRRWLLGIDDAITESQFPVMTKGDLQCTPQGQVLLIPGALSAFDLNVELEKKLAQERQEFWESTPKAEALQAVRRIADIRKLTDLPALKIEKSGVIQRRDYVIEKLVLVPEVGISLPALFFKPREATEDTYLYLNGEGKHVDADAGGPIEKLVVNGHPVLAVDLRGIGETEGVGSYKGWEHLFGPDWQDFFRAYLLGKSYLGMRTEDILVSARFLASGNDSRKPCGVHLIGIGEVGPPALHAAALEPQLFTSIQLERSIRSWSNVIRTPVSKNQLINAVHGALKTYDLPDLLATLPNEKITVIQPFKADNTPID